MTILYICSKDPRLKNGGNEQRTNLLWTSLKKIGEVYTIVYNDNDIDEPLYDEDDNSICFLSTNESYYNRTIKGIGYAILFKLIGFGLLPYKYPSRINIKNVFNGVSFDIVVTRYIQDPSRYHLWKIAPTFVDIDDHPVQTFETIRKYRWPKLFRPFLGWFVEKQFNTLLQHITGGWIANEEQSVGMDDKIKFLPNIPQQLSLSYNAQQIKRDYLFSIGVMSYEPNCKGIFKFLTEIWPIFHKKHPNVKYIIGGKSAPTDLIELINNTEGVEYTGYIDDLDKVYEYSIATIVPIYSGGGTCIKTLESLAHSRICISTKFGARGLNLMECDKKGLYIFNNANEFIRIYEDIINSKSIREIETNAQRFINQNYSVNSFDSKVADLIDSYHSLKICQK